LAASAVAGTALLSGATAVSHTRQDPATATAPKVFEIVAKRFEFEPNRIEVEEGDRVRLVVRSADGVHGIGIKRFKVGELVPRKGNPKGDTVTIEFVAAAAGSFEIACTEHCGDGHEEMKGTLVVRAKPR
jgi:cytochrome c oxidase subunit 2